jgi:prepilin-type N-terminal cleavage/methylation domain-containing protein
MAAIRNKNYGFTVAELLVALAVMAILLTAVAVAFNAAAINYNENTEMYNAINTGRNAMLRMTNELRTAEPNSIPLSEASTQCSFIDAKGRISKYRYDSSNKQLWLDYLDGGSSRSALICNDVTAMTWTRWPTTGIVKGVQMSMTVTAGNNHQTIAGAVVLRRML